VTVPARAEDEPAFSAGVHLTFSFGDEAMFGVGIDVRGSLTFDARDGICTSVHELSGVGLFGQATWLIGHGGRFSLGAHGGANTDPDTSIDGELGWTYRLMARGRSGHGLHLGLVGTRDAFDLIGRASITFDDHPVLLEGEVGAGLRVPPMFGTRDSCVVGRALRQHGVLQLGRAVVVGRARRASYVAPETRLALGQSWLEAARAEAASVPAFLRLREDLRAVRAPSSLLRRATSAARDEVRHTRLCRDLASPELGVDLRILAPPLPAATPSSRAAALTNLALGSWHDGCLGEGTAARRAEVARDAAKDERAKAALTLIARDEEAHAELAWSVLEYAIAKGGAPVRAALLHAVATTPERTTSDAESRGAECADPKIWSALGRLDGIQIASAREQVVASATVRAKRLIDQMTGQAIGQARI